MAQDPAACRCSVHVQQQPVLLPPCVCWRSNMSAALLQAERKQRASLPPAAHYPDREGSMLRDLIEEVRGQSHTPPFRPASASVSRVLACVILVKLWQLPLRWVPTSASNAASSHIIKVCCGGPAAPVCCLSPLVSLKLISAVWVQGWTWGRMGMYPWPMGTQGTTLTLVRHPAAAGCGSVCSRSCPGAWQLHEQHAVYSATAAACMCTWANPKWSCSPSRHHLPARLQAPSGWAQKLRPPADCCCCRRAGSPRGSADRPGPGRDAQPVGRRRAPAVTLCAPFSGALLPSQLATDTETATGHAGEVLSSLWPSQWGSLLSTCTKAQTRRPHRHRPAALGVACWVAGNEQTV